MSTDSIHWDLRPLEEAWERRRAGVQAVAARTDRRGMTRPRRNPVERKWLMERGELPPVEEANTPLNDQESCPQPRENT